MSVISWGGDRCDYVLDLDVKGSTVNGYSYTYFTDGGKKYYTICKLKGTADLKKKYIEVTETERTKTNVPDNISNSFQLHKLKWRKENNMQILEGTWEPANERDKNSMGYGTTSLTKRQLTEIIPLAKKIVVNRGLISPRDKPLAAVKESKPILPDKKYINGTVKSPKKISPPVAKASGKLAPKTLLPAAGKDTSAKPIKSVIVLLPVEKLLPSAFEKRNNSVLQTIITENAAVKIELYDNGEIDGDSISLFYNGRLLLAHKKLTDNPIILELPVVDEEENELVMYADNLGTLPPNTALMIVRDGHKRYEVRITSDLKKSGTIRFVHREN